jgi:hypothetical protein
MSAAGGNDDAICGITALSFLPEDLVLKCTLSIKRYHARRGYFCLPDLLWRTNARVLIESDKELGRSFRKSLRRKSFKQVNSALLSIAAHIVAAEVLARDVGDWGNRFPKEKEMAERLLAGYASLGHGWLIDLYEPSFDIG